MHCIKTRYQRQLNVCVHSHLGMSDADTTYGYVFYCEIFPFCYCVTVWI